MATARLGRVAAHLDPPPPSPATSSGAALPPSATQDSSAGLPAVFNREIVDTFDETKWLADGYYAWPGIMTDSCRQRFSESLRFLQDTQGACSFANIFKQFQAIFVVHIWLRFRAHF